MSTAGSSSVSLDIIEAKSPANKYLVRLLEDKGTVSFQPLTAERTQLVFQILDKVIPQLGVFSRLIGLIRAELYDAVYSHPGSQLWKDLQGPAAAPYFSLVRQMQNDRNEEAERVMSELQQVTAVLLQREEEILALRNDISNAQEKNQTLEAAISALRLEAEKNQRKIERLELEMKNLEKHLKEERLKHTQSMSDLQDQLDSSHGQIQKMEERTTSYQALQRVFQSAMMHKKENVLSAPGKVPADRTAVTPTFVSSYLQANKHLYQQLLYVQNAVMDDFDAFLESQDDTSGTGHSQTRQDEEMERFLHTFSEISLELALLSQQRNSLEERETSHNKVSSGAESLNPGGLLGDTESQEKMGDNHIGRFLSVALYPDETLLNRYAAVIYASTDNGRVFEELPGGGVCHSCAEKTLLCPHKIGGSQVIRLPRNCTHIKVCRPRAHLSALQDKIAATKMASPESPIPGNHTTEITQKSPDVTRSQSQGASWAVDRSLSRLGTEYEKWIHMKRESCRMISLDLCLSLTQQVAANIVLQLEGRLQASPIQDTMWEFFQRRYIREDISSRGLEDYLSALRRYSLNSQVLCLVGAVLQHDLDPATLGYILLHTEVLQASPVSDMDQFQLFLQQHYHFLEETEQDRLLLEFTAYSNKRVSPACIMGFVLRRILQHRDPLILECQAELATRMKTHTGHLTLEELTRALDEMCPHTDKTLIQRCVSLTGQSPITLHRAAQIAAYQLERMKRWRKRRSVLSPQHSHPGAAGTTGSNRTESPTNDSDLQLLCDILHLSRQSR
ncbi:uncharacterized protein [Hyperolius riggenbachi]|uniref:uncharacterized protein n=1 Tax=Hyperolius riggenbachi TaxID=752182 RepID=UPI0035A338AB